MLAESWARRTLEAASIDMVYAPPLLAAQVYNVCNTHWVVHLLLVSPTRTYLCPVLDPMCNRPYIVGANTEELAIVNLIVEQEGIEPRPQKKWDRFWGDFGSVAFAIAPLYSTFLHQVDGVSCHRAYLLMLHCLLSRRVVNGSMQFPQDRLWLLCEIAQAALHYRYSAHASPIQTTPSWAIVLAFALGDRRAVDKPPLVDEVRPKVVIRGTEFFVPEHYPKDAYGRLLYDKKLIEELDMKTTDVLRNMCKHNPPSAQPTYKDKNKKSGPHLQPCVLRLHIKHTCVHPCMFDLTAPTLAMALPGCLVLLLPVLFLVPRPSEDFFVELGSASAQLAIRSLTRVGLHLHKWPRIRGHHALKQKYHLPLTPPPHKLCFFRSNSSPNLCLPSNLVKQISNFLGFFDLVKQCFFKKNILYLVLLRFAGFYYSAY